jgi:hypothetical protein
VDSRAVMGDSVNNTNGSMDLWAVRFIFRWSYRVDASHRIACMHCKLFIHQWFFFFFIKKKKKYTHSDFSVLIHILNDIIWLLVMILSCCMLSRAMWWHKCVGWLKKMGVFVTLFIIWIR